MVEFALLHFVLIVDVNDDDAIWIVDMRVDRMASFETNLSLHPPVCYPHLVLRTKPVFSASVLRHDRAPFNSMCMFNGFWGEFRGMSVEISLLWNVHGYHPGERVK